MKIDIVKYGFVDAIPEKIEQGTLYIAMDYATAVHKCCCGCGLEVVTPLSPTDWKMTYDGVSVSLLPSIGNWSFPCQSHYWIVRNSVRWADQWTPEQIEAGRAADRRAKRHRDNRDPVATGTKHPAPAKDLWSRIWNWFTK